MVAGAASEVNLVVAIEVNSTVDELLVGFGSLVVEVVLAVHEVSR